MADPVRPDLAAAEEASTRVSPLTSASPTPSQPDTMIGVMLGNFRIVRQLGVGGMGTVYLGEHAVIGSKVAVKFLHPHLCGDPSLVARFMDEARAVNLVGHHHIVSILDLSYWPPDRYYMVMELLEGRTLLARLQAGRVELPAALSIIVQICEGLEAAHSAGIVHRDLKPDNVFLIRQGGNSDYVKIVDFGIAKMLASQTGHTAVGLLVGTPEYMPPEQWNGEAIDGRADLYALGIIAYQLATGRQPFVGRDIMSLFKAHVESRPTPPRQLEPMLPEALERLILKALSRNPDDRFRTAEEMGRAAQAILDGLRAPPPPVAPTTPAKPAVAPARAQVWPARVALAGAAGSRDVHVADLARGGLFVRCGPPFPETFARVKVTVLHPEGELALDGEVVRSVTAEQAGAWGMEPGFAVQVREASLAQRQGLERLARGLAPVEATAAVARSDDPAAERMLLALEAQKGRDPYALLGLAKDCVGSEVHRCVRQAIQDMVALAARMSPGQRERADTQLERLHAALTVLGTPKFRAGHDGEEGNFRGVARCLQAGLNIEELGGLRASFVQRKAEQVKRAEACALTARAREVGGRKDLALADYEAALALDPLSLELQQRYWTLKRAAK